MKYLACIFTMLLGIAGAFAQNPVTPEQSVPQPVPQTSPVPATAPETKPEFNSPQSPNRPAQVPSEDTLIKGQKSSGAVIHDTLMPTDDKRKDRSERRKNRKGTAEKDDTTSTHPQADPARKP
ncbi:hypothetical protein SAMN04487996_106359 [Dyadobacter soli]|uniref:Uncharacterized protein n=1 Tax=Dyadobacter soli TaxID=659014 RepID=A0A1G7FDV5_9BACT|nr:hypothetical protein [Dyadobacter soli]SDE74017.1 hypothetical protein SAMN04487996_106359 [Dyadobacter soli]